MEEIKENQQPIEQPPVSERPADGEQPSSVEIPPEKVPTQITEKIKPSEEIPEEEVLEEKKVEVQSMTQIPTEVRPSGAGPSPSEILIRRKELLVRARQKKKEVIRKNEEKILEFLREKGKISNDKVQKLLRVSHATAFRYLRNLEKKGLISRFGSGKNIIYRLK